MNIATRNKTLLTVLVILLAAGPALAGEKGEAATDTVVEDITITPARIVIPQEWNVLSKAAAGILRYIADARGDIAQKDPKAALKSLEPIDKAVTTIKEGRPVAVIEDRIRIAKKHLEYEKTTEVAADLIPIATDLTYLEDVVPVQEARKHVAAAREHMKKGNKKAAGKELAALEDSISYTEIDLPLAETVRQVERARKYLKEKKLAAADKALKAAENGMVILSTTVEEPVVKARHSLEQAKKHHAANRDKVARNDLANAMAWIDRAEHSGDDKVRAKAAQLAKAVHELEKEMK